VAVESRYPLCQRMGLQAHKASFSLSNLYA
jgi:hypothetical protein